ncbi:flavin-containing monooxygenase [Nocardia sp. NPDC004711]
MTYNKLVGEIDFDPQWLRKKYRAERDRRIRPEGKRQFTGASGKFAQFARDPWTPSIERAPLSEHSAVIIAGGGFGGLLMGARLHEAGIRDIRVIEIGGDFGGTWYWNRYPGAMCDIEAHTYLPLLEELGWIPRHRYAHAAEMFELSQKIGSTYGLYDRACFQTSVTAAQWNEQSSRWTIETDRGDRLTTDYFVIACGRQSLPRFPALPGIDDYEGHIFHTSRWDYGYTGGSADGQLANLADKRIGIVGTGATALQVVPAVAPYAQELLVFQRTPSTVGFRGQRETGPDWVDRSRPGWQRKRRDNFQAHVQYGTTSGHIAPSVDLIADGWTSSFALLAEPEETTVARLGRKPTPEELELISEINDFRLMNQVRERVRTTVKDPVTAAALEPWYRWWCKRPGWHDDYLEAFNRENVTLVDTNGHGIERFTRTGVVTDGKKYGVDCLVMATGFESSVAYTHLTGFELQGRDGISLTQHWAAGVRTLHGITTDNFPSLFFMGGNPQTAAAINAVHMLDEQAQYIARAIACAIREGDAVLEAQPDAVDLWVKEIVESPRLQTQLEFYLECTPGYFNAEGAARSSADLFTGMRYPAGALAYFKLLRNWTFGDPQSGYRFIPQT